MQEHLIPQDISNYQFHLIGELDLKQFSEIMLGIILAVVIYQFNWPAYIKWPIMISFAGLGLIAAFFPIAGQPLSHWLKVLFKNLYAPTKFYWHKDNQIPSYFNYELSDSHRDFLESVTTFNASPVKKHKALDYFHTLEKNKAEEDKLEIFNSSNLNQVAQKLQPEIKKTTTEPATIKKLIIKPQVKTSQSQRVRQIITPSQKTLDSFLKNSNIFQPTTITDKITSVNQPKSNLYWPTNNAASKSTPIINQPDSINQGIPKILPKPNLSTEKTPNLSGIVVDQNNKPLADVLISVKDTNNNLKTIIKTNQLGQFYYQSPLHPDNYILSPQKDNYQFNEELINIDDQGIAPLLLITK